MKTTVIYHSADMDGIFCREIARKFLLDTDAELIGWNFADKPLEPIIEGQVYILDLPVDRPFGYDFAKLPLTGPLLNELQQRVIWIDHHASSIASHPTFIPGYRIDGVAACRLVWQWFSVQERHEKAPCCGYSSPAHLPYCVFWNPGNKVVQCHNCGQIALPEGKGQYFDRLVSEPLAVRLAGEYDIWDKRDPRAEVFQFGLRSRKLGESDWNRLLSYDNDWLVDELLHDGRFLQAYQQSNDVGTMHRSFLIGFEGLKFLALNTARCNSLAFASKDVPETGHDALLGFFFNGTKWTVSMYHAAHRKDLDLSTIAIKHGGGGHKGACGFTSDKFPFV